MDPVYTIAIDGPVGAGKSTIADAVARRLGILHLDTGAMYRALALHALDTGIDPQDESAMAALCAQQAIELDVQFAQGAQTTLLNGRDVGGRIRTPAVSAAASAISRYRPVRQWLVARQRQIARTQSMVVDGRDIGTVVLPHADVKIFLTAAPEVRAQRRLRQMREQGQQADYAQVLAQLRARDLQDQTRAVDPLKQADDAALLDTTDLTFEQTADAIIKLVEGIIQCRKKGS